MGLILTTQLVNAQVPSYVPTNGLVGYWPFSGNANDLSGNNNNGTVNGATLTTDRFGNANSAYNFDGINDLISIPDSNNLSITNNITMAAWVYVNSDNQNYHSILSKRLNGNWSYNLSLSYYFGPGGSPTEVNKVFSGRRNNFGAQLEYKFSNEPIVFGQWLHITVKIENNVITFYKNGIDMGVNLYGNQFTIPMINQAIGLAIGSNGDGGEWFNGKLDDIGIWNRALSEQEITNMYNGVTYSDTCNAVSGSLTQGLVGYWPFCGNANDDSGNGHNGTVNGATLTEDRFGNNNSAYGFDGVNDLIKVNHSSSFNTFPMSISLWCKGNSQYGALISKYTSCSSDNGWQLHTMEGKVSTYSYNFLGGAFLNCDGDSNTIISDNNWYNIVSTYDLSGVKIYVNNVLVLTKPYIGSGSMSAPTNIQDLYIGTEINSIGCSPYNTYYQGLIDDIGIWNRVLTQQEITQLFNQNQCITNITVTDTLIINVGQLSYTNPVSFANNITIYPNPASTQVNISFNNITDLAGGSIKIINSLGQQVATTPITATGTNTTMALNSWGGTGLYFVQILNAQGQILDIKKIILQ